MTNLIINHRDEIDARNRADNAKDFRRGPKLVDEWCISWCCTSDLSSASTLTPEAVGEHGFGEEFAAVFVDGGFGEEGKGDG
jgi:hypothetical protein